MPHKTVFCLLGVSRNPANGFPARLLEDWSVPRLQRLRESVLKLFQHTANDEPQSQGPAVETLVYESKLTVIARSGLLE